MSNELYGVTEETESSREYELPVIETERLRLRGYRPEDLRPEALEEAFNLLHHTIPNFASRAGRIYDLVIKQGSECLWTVEQKSDNTAIGLCGLDFGSFLEYKGMSITRNKIDEAILFYAFNSAYHHQGLASEAVTGLLAFGFMGLDIDKFIAETELGNHDSQRLLHRVGARFESFISHPFSRGSSEQVATFSITAESFYNQRGEHLKDIRWPSRYLFNDPK
jgi:RimJ/RimL family protein N-acetyltransferase